MQDIINKAIELGINNTAFIKTKDIIFSEDLRATCEQNICRSYGTNWMCPPGIGTAPDCINRVKSFENGLLIQIFVKMKNSFDINAMMEGGKKFKNIMKNLKEEMNKTYTGNFLILGAGGCNDCEKCAYVTNEPCRFPETSFSSVEAHGIYVSDIMKKAGLAYNDGPNSFAYVGMILF